MTENCVAAMRARPLDGSGVLFELTGHKWFCSVPMCDAFLTVALQASLLVRHVPQAVADAFCAARLGDGRSLVFGGLAPGHADSEILERA